MNKPILVILLMCCFCPLSGLGQQIDTVFINKDYVNEFGDSITVKSADTGYNIYKTDSSGCLIDYEYWRYYLDGWCYGDYYLKETGTLKSRNPDVKSGLVKRYYSDYSKENIEFYSDGELVSIISQVSFISDPFDTISPPIYELIEIYTAENERIYSENKHSVQQLLPNDYGTLLTDNSQIPPSRFWLTLVLNKQGVIESIKSERLEETEFMKEVKNALTDQQLSPHILHGTAVRTSFILPLNINWK